MNFSLRLRFLLLLFAMAILGGTAGYRFYAWYQGEVAQVLGQRFAERNVLYEKARVLGMLTREVTLVQKMANARTLSAWAENENDPVLRSRAIAELEEYREFLRDRSYSFAHAATGSYYFNDASGRFDKEKPRYVLEQDNAKDAWFFLTLKGDRDTQLNVDTDRNTHLTKVWINSIVRNPEGRPVAVVSGGLDLSEFIDRVVNSGLPGTVSILVDRNGAIQGHPDASKIDFASARKAAGKEVQNTLFALLDDPGEADVLRNAMARLSRGENEVATQILALQGNRQLVGLTWLPEIEWFVVTMMQTDTVVPGNGMATAVLWLIAAFALVFMAAMLVLQKTVLGRLVRLDYAAREMGRGRLDIDIPADASNDEIGRLTRTFKTMADHIAAHTENLERQVAERTEQLAQMARTDFLTGVLNRRGMMEKMESERKRHLSDGGMLAILIADIDHFKGINDSQGHAFGDRALVAVADALSTFVADREAIARWGGEEFLLLVNGITTFAELEAVAERLLTSVRLATIEHDGKRLSITVSIGGVLADPNAEIDAVIHMADQMLYRAKNEGRDCAVLDCLLTRNGNCDHRSACMAGARCPVDGGSAPCGDAH